ncbi:MAG: hypothetical protein D6813_01290 [Calditrichaeota bacterium]|nr:MAG: hypothetical protein D6813_01290 [Calditrichota bacterium]
MITKEREIKALITLLGDEDQNIRNIAREKLLDFGEMASDYLRDVVHKDYEGRIRIEAWKILEEIRLEKLTDEFRKLSQAKVFDLEEGAFLLAQFEYPNLDVQAYKQQIDEMAEEIHGRIFEIRDVRRMVHVINQYLFYEQGFRGNVESYYDPQNSYINRVLDRKLGIPISLSALYLFIADRLDLPIFGVGLPGHFMLKFHCEWDEFYIDAFNYGQLLSKNDCVNFLKRMGYTYNESYFNIAKPRDILARMIRNLVLIYHQKNQKNKVDVLERFFSLIVNH